MLLINSVIYLVSLIALVWVIYDVWAVNKKMDNTAKIIWTIAAIIFSIITAVVYYFVEKK